MNHGDRTPTCEIPLTGSWAVTRIDVGSSQHVTVPAGYNAGFSWQPGQQTVGLHKSPTTVWAEDSIGARNEDGRYDCTYQRGRDTFTLLSSSAGGVPKVNPTTLDRAISDVFELAFCGNTKMSVARAANNGLSDFAVDHLDGWIGYRPRIWRRCPRSTSAAT